MFKNFTFPLGINIVCLIITAIAPTIAIGPLVGTPLGLACSFGLLAAMEYQRSADGNVRSAAMALVWLIRFFAVTLEQIRTLLRAGNPCRLDGTQWCGDG